ncbi:MAG: nucleotidyltransferase domain-containing protein [Candidatus Omnitrophota bacterium]
MFNLPQKVKKTIEDFVKNLEDIYKDDLVSVVLYGSAATKEFTKYSNVNLLIVLNDTGLENLSKISKMINKAKFHALNSVFFSESYIHHSADVFPIEFLDMKENNFILYGKDILKDLEIDIKNLRFQCEQELKSKLVNIRRAYLRANKYELKNLLFAYFTSSLYVLRNLLRLKGKNPPYSKKDLLKQLQEEFEITVEPFVKILEAKNQNLRLNYDKVNKLFISFVGELEKISDIIDRS